ncbi:cell wall-binding repeat-containing protein [Cytobacillus firmus]|uniref:cell wall-binding repeat-containing protein n=1 Tax=Cytobacillus firmus TaxID=1399 RepID=UPI00216201AB|nr:cell wall-binding repeat-containing protein [Cytobacillus firmus]MCS0673439.1 cell wall-binding repeat-containing protein [Cytobacillus firmus]
MKKQNRKKAGKIASYALTSALVLSSFSYTASATAKSSNDFYDQKISQIKELKAETLKKTELKDKTLKSELKASDTVRVIVELDGKTPLETATEEGKLYKELSESTKKSLTSKVIKQQSSVKSAIKSKGVKFEYLKNFSTAFNGFSGEVKYGEVAKIEGLSGVKAVYLANAYNRPEVEPNMKTSHSFIQSAATWGDAGYKGEGMIVSVIDTGVDPSHKDFQNIDKTNADLEKSEVDALVKEDGLKGKYYSDKVPYGYNYYDSNDTILDLGPAASMHGMHVAGTVAANGDEKTGGIKGVAPEAQVLGMKVFSNDPNFPSTWSDVYLAAIDDSIKLGADVLNMSLGSTAAFYEEQGAEDIAITRAVENGIVSAVSAGNSAHLGSGWDAPYAKNPDIGVVGSPGLNPDTLQVAASGNVAYLYQHQATVGGKTFTGYGVDDWSSLAASGLELVSLSQANGVTEESGKACKVCGNPSDYEGVDVEGKIVVVKRGTLSFFDKTVNAAEAGAAGIIVYDSGGGTFYENQGGWDVPFMMLSAGDGEELEKAIANGDATASVAQTSKKEDPVMGRMTDFTSWGVTPDLRLKPEITAPGGNIYSTVNDDKYTVMSGTSMAAPHVAGGSALVQQFLQEDDRFSDLDFEQRTRLAKVLLVNTAKTIDDVHGQPFSPRRQGAGMMQTFSAVSSPAILTDQSTGEAKVELFDFKETKFELPLAVTNISDSEEVTYNVKTRVLADTIQQVEGEEDRNALIAGELTGVEVDGPETVTVAPGETVEFTVTVDISKAKLPGLDKDGKPISLNLKEDIFVEGFVHLEDAKKDSANPTLTVPYLGFYGEWDRPEIFDGFKTLGENRFYDAFPTATDMLVENGDYFADMLKVDGKDVYAFSPNGDGNLDDINALPAMLRNAKELQTNILDKDGKQVARVNLESNVRKNWFDSGDTNPYDFNPERAWDGKIKGEAAEDGLYYYELKGKVHYEGAEWQTKKVPVYVDKTAPKLEAEYDAETKTVSWEASDAGVGIAAYAVFVNGVKVADAAADKTSVVLDSIPEKAVVEVAAVDKVYNVSFDEVAVGDSGLPIIDVSTDELVPFGQYNTRSITFSGLVHEDIALKSLTVNGKDVSFKQNDKGEYEFTATVTFEQDGKYDVQIVATDVSGKEFSFARKIMIDTTSPVLNTDAPRFVDKEVEEVTFNVDIEDNFNAFTLLLDGEKVFVQQMEELAEPDTATAEVTVPVKEGDNSFTLTLVDGAGNETEQEVNIYRNEDAERVNRISGADRYVTAVEISKKGWTEADTVVLATGDNYADALAGIPLAKKNDAPLLLTKPNSLSDATKAEIERLGAKKVIILGGKGAVSEAIARDLEDSGLNVERLSGKDRFATAAAIAYEVAPNGAEEVVVVRGKDFPDALSAAAYAASNGMPILLTEMYSLPSVTSTAIRDLGASKSLVIGGTGVVSFSVASELPNPYRLGGKTRYETSLNVAKHFDNGAYEYYVATGKQFADALAGAALAAKNDTGILLTDANLPAETEVFLAEESVEKVTVLGGKGAVSETVFTKLKNLFK